MNNIKYLLVVILITIFAFKTSGVNVYAEENTKDITAISCSSSFQGVVATMIALIVGYNCLGWYFQPKLDEDNSEPNPSPEYDTATFFGTITITRDERIEKNPNVDFIKDYFSINIIDDAGKNCRISKNNRFAIGTITKSSKFEVTYLNEVINNSQFYAWADDDQEMQDVKELVLKFPHSEKPSLVNIKLQRIDNTAKTDQFKTNKREVDVVLALKLEDNDQRSSGFRCCTSGKDDHTVCGTIKIFDDQTNIRGFREIIQYPNYTCKKLKFLFNGNNLPTLVGEKEDISLVSQKGKSGFLSFGPYLSLPKGKYNLRITLITSSESNEKLGYWDISAYKLYNQIKQGDIIGSSIETDFEVTDQFSENTAFEIRTFTYGNGDIKLVSIIIEQK